jgi:hypothetical protein
VRPLEAELGSGLAHRRGEVHGVRFDIGRQRRGDAKSRQVDRQHVALLGEPLDYRAPDRGRAA